MNNLDNTEEYSSILEDLQSREIINNVSNEQKLATAQIMGAGVYCGFDPTGKSLHLGNLLQVILLKRFQTHGFNPIAVVGGATGMIGDPSGKKSERQLLDPTTLQTNMTAISDQLEKLFSSSSTSLSIFSFIEQYNLLDKDDFESLEMIVKSINPNDKYKEMFAKLLKKLPLPFQEINLDKATLRQVYQHCHLDATLADLYFSLDDLSFKELFNYQDLLIKNWEGLLKFSYHGPVLESNPLKAMEIVNNLDWLKSLNFIDFLRDIGKDFNLNNMIRKENVATRLETGISYTEFSYMALQAYDFLELYSNHECYVQIGGSDQWGNMTAGLDLISKKTPESLASIVTINLLTDEQGNKFGKSEKGAIFLDSNMTLPYEMYQFLFNQSDGSIQKLLNALSLMEVSAIKAIINLHEQNKSLRLAQKVLANLIVLMVHGYQGLFDAQRITKALFEGKIKNIKPQELLQVFSNFPKIEIDKEQIGLVDLMINYGICSSKREARELIVGGAINLNDNKIIDVDSIIRPEDALIKNFAHIIKKGKKGFYLVTYKNI